MNLVRCQILGFGKLTNLTLDFQRGLNLVFASNEAGKTTLQHFLLGLLYGQLRPDLKNQRRLEPWAEAFKPWQGSQYAGILWCELANGRKLEMHRSFGKEEDHFEVRTSTGEDITSDYEQQKNGEVLFAKTHLGMPKELFQSVAVIRENQVDQLNDEGTIRDRIANLAQTGDENLSVRKSLKSLEDSLKEIGSEQAPTRPYRQAQDRVQELLEERRIQAARWDEYQGWVQERNRLLVQIIRLEEKMLEAQRRVVAARLKETARTIEGLEKMQIELDTLRQEIETSEAVAGFPANRIDEFNRLVGVRESLGRRLLEVQTALQTARSGLQQAEIEWKSVAHYANVQPEKVTEWVVSFSSLSEQQQSVEQAVAHTGAEIARLKDELDQLGPAFKDEKIDWQLKTRAAAETELEASQRSVKLAGKLAMKHSALAGARQGAVRKGALGAFMLAFAVAVFWLAPMILARNLVSRILSYLLSAAVSMWGIALLVGGFRSLQSLRRIELEIKDLQADEERVLEQARGAYREILPAMEASGYPAIADFLAAARQAAQLCQKTAGLEARVLEMDERRAKLSGERSAIYASLAECLNKFGLECTPENLPAQVDALRQEFKRYVSLDSEYRNLRKNLDSMQREESRLSEDCKQATSDIRAILAEARVDTAESFRDADRKFQSRLRQQEREASLIREYGRLCGFQTLEEWRRRLREQPDAPNPALMEEVLSREDAEREEKQAAALLASTREAYARLAERVSQAFQGQRTLSEIDEDLAWEEQSLQKLALNREALNEAVILVHELSREQQEVLAPQLNRVVEQRFLRLCEGRHPEVKIDLELNAWVRDTGSGDLRRAEDLSRGTQDQLYFALRFGVLDLVSNGKEPCPCLLDEPFVAYDRARLAEAFGVLQEEAARRQLILFTCREDVRDLALARGATLVALP